MDRSIDLAFCLFFMIRLEKPGLHSRICDAARKAIVFWDESRSLGDVMSDEFQISETKVSREQEFSALLTARNLELYGGFRIR